MGENMKQYRLVTIEREYASGGSGEWQRNTGRFLEIS